MITDKHIEFAQKLSLLIDFELREEEWELTQIQKFPQKDPNQIIFFIVKKK